MTVGAFDLSLGHYQALGEPPFVTRDGATSQPFDLLWRKYRPLYVRGGIGKRSTHRGQGEWRQDPERGHLEELFRNVGSPCTSPLHGYLENITPPTQRNPRTLLGHKIGYFIFFGGVLYLGGGLTQKRRPQTYPLLAQRLETGIGARSRNKRWPGQSGYWLAPATELDPFPTERDGVSLKRIPGGIMREPDPVRENRAGTTGKGSFWRKKPFWRKKKYRAGK